MTVPTTTDRNIYDGTGAQTVFPYTFQILQNSDMQVSLIDADGVETVLTISTDYTVSGAGEESGGNVTLLVAPAVGVTVLLLRLVPYTQPTDYKNQGSFYPRTHERSFDRATMQIQQVAVAVGRSLRLFEADTDGSGRYSANGNRVVGAADAVNAQDLVTLAQLGDATNANAPFIQAGTGAVARTVQDKAREIVSVKDFGAVGDGVTDDTTAIQAGIDYVAENGGTLYFPAGTYNINSLLGVSSAAKPFAIIGSGVENTKIVRASDFAGSMLSINTSDNWTVSDLSLDAQHATYPNGNHGIVWFNCSHVRVQRVNVSDWKNSAIIGYTFPASTAYVDNVIEDCWVDGLNAANNGILIADLVQSGLRNCSAVNIGKTGSPCYALQMKNGCQDSFIEGGLATGASIGIACGNYDTSGTHSRNRISGVRVFNCDVGLAFGAAIGDHASNILIDMNSAGLAAVDFNTNTVGCTVRGVTIRNLAAGKQAVRFRSGDTDNVAEIDTIANSSGIAQLAADFNAGSLRNSVKLRRYVNPTTVSSTTVLVSNLSSSPTNIFEYEALPQKQVSTIASGVVTIRDSSVKLLRLDTEGGAATDDLDSIASGTDGQIVTLETTANARDVVVKHLAAGGNIRLNGLVDFTLDGAADSLTLIYKSALSQWCEVSRSNNA